MARELPLIRTSGLQSILAAADYLGVSPDSVLRDYGLSRRAVGHGNGAVHAMVLYRVVEDLAAASSDHQFGARLGEKLSKSFWPPLAAPGGSTYSVGDVLTQMVGRYCEYSTAAIAGLDVGHNWTVLHFTRTFEVPLTLAHNEAALITLLLELMRSSVGSRWDPAYVTLMLSDGTALPEECQRMNTVKGDQRERRIWFPTPWLWAPIATEIQSETTGRDKGITAPLPTSFVDALREALKPHVRESALSNARAASLFGASKQAVERELRRNGTTLRMEIDALRCEAAKTALGDSDRTISEVSATLGFSEPSNFARSFRRWTGSSPKQFRSSIFDLRRVSNGEH